MGYHPTPTPINNRVKCLLLWLHIFTSLNGPVSFTGPTRPWVWVRDRGHACGNGEYRDDKVSPEYWRSIKSGLKLSPLHTENLGNTNLGWSRCVSSWQVRWTYPPFFSFCFFFVGFQKRKGRTMCRHRRILDESKRSPLLSTTLSTLCRVDRCGLHPHHAEGSRSYVLTPQKGSLINLGDREPLKSWSSRWGVVNKLEIRNSHSVDKKQQQPTNQQNTPVFCARFLRRTGRWSAQENRSTPPRPVSRHVTSTSLTRKFLLARRGTNLLI